MYGLSGIGARFSANLLRPSLVWRFSAVFLFVTIMLWGTFFRNGASFSATSFHSILFRYNKNKTIDNDHLIKVK
jgi:hypothetical protein